MVQAENGWVEDDDLTAYVDLSQSSIEKDSCDIGGATARFTLCFYDGKEIPHWPSLTLRPSMRLVNGDDHTEWYNLGVFYAETPKLIADQTPQIWTVDCHDVITALDTPRVEGLLIPQGTTVSGAIIIALGRATTLPLSPDILNIQETLRAHPNTCLLYTSPSPRDS